MARAPAAAALAVPPAAPGVGGAAMGGMGADPSAGGDAGGDAGDDTDSGGGDDVVVTICSDGQGGYLVYAGDEPSDSDSDVSDDDADAMDAGGGAGAGPGGGAAMGGPGGGVPAPQGQPADSIGAALKIVMTILQGDQSSQGGGGSPDDQFSAGFSASKSPTPATGAPQKY